MKVDCYVTQNGCALGGKSLDLKASFLLVTLQARFLLVTWYPAFYLVDEMKPGSPPVLICGTFGVLGILLGNFLCEINDVKTQ